MSRASRSEAGHPRRVLGEATKTFAGGFLMGTADLVPGVSGGTIALVIGIYERLVASIRAGSAALGSLGRLDLARTRRHLREVEWRFLLTLLAGILTAVIVLADVLGTQLETRPSLLAGVFLGLVASSVVVAWRLLRHPRPIHLVVAWAVAIALFAVLGVGGPLLVADPGLLIFFASGALAICAMILPGISGSLILLLVGMYGPVLGAVTERDALPIVVFAGGAVVGLALFSQALHWALLRHHDMVVASLIGLMAGSIRVLWPWPDGVESARLGSPGGDWPWVLIATLLGALAVTAITRLSPEPVSPLRERRPV